MAESEIVPNRHVFVSIVVGEIKEKVDNYSQSGYCSSNNIKSISLWHSFGGLSYWLFWTTDSDN